MIVFGRCSQKELGARFSSCLRILLSVRRCGCAAECHTQSSLPPLGLNVSNAVFDVFDVCRELHSSGQIYLDLSMST